MWTKPQQQQFIHISQMHNKTHCVYGNVQKEIEKEGKTKK